MKKRIIALPGADGEDARWYTEKAYITRNLFGFLIVVILLLTSLVIQS